MRFTRLKKAVENGEFRNALLVQPNAKTPSSGLVKFCAIQRTSKAPPQHAVSRVSGSQLAEAEDSDEHEKCTTVTHGPMHMTQGSEEALAGARLGRAGASRANKSCARWTLGYQQNLSSNVDDDNGNGTAKSRSNLEDRPQTYTHLTDTTLSPRVHIDSGAGVSEPFDSASHTSMFFESPPRTTHHEFGNPLFLDTTRSLNSLLDDDDPLSILASFDPNMHRAGFTTSSYRR